jgi:MFS family permease
MFGMIIGGIVFGVFGDKMGRLATLFGSILLYSIANLANSFVDTFAPYAFWRFVAGFGLAGELGGCISLVSETLSRERRGYGTTMVATIGVFGAVVGGLLAEVVSWRNNLRIGGVLGLILLIMRVSVKESKMFNRAKEADKDVSGLESVSRGNFLALFNDKERFIKYAYCILIGLPTWFLIGILGAKASSHFAPAFNIQGNILANRVIALFYTGITLGDLASGVISQLIRSRRKTVFAFLTFSLIMVLIYLFCLTGASESVFYAVICIMGFGMGYWAIFVTIAAEQFGTNLRATVATTVPNFARGSLVPLTFIFTELSPRHISVVSCALLLTVLCFGIAFLALWRMEETYGKDLDYLEIQMTGTGRTKNEESCSPKQVESL